MRKRGIERAVEVAGSCGRLAESLKAEGHDVTRQAIALWLRHGYVPSKRVIAVERLTGIHRHYLNPEIYPDPPPPPPALPPDTLAA